MFNRQVIMVTHNRHLSEMSDKWYRVELVDSVSLVSGNDESQQSWKTDS